MEPLQASSQIRLLQSRIMLVRNVVWALFVLVSATAWALTQNPATGAVALAGVVSLALPRIARRDVSKRFTVTVFTDLAAVIAIRVMVGPGTVTDFGLYTVAAEAAMLLPTPAMLVAGALTLLATTLVAAQPTSGVFDTEVLVRIEPAARVMVIIGVLATMRAIGWVLQTVESRLLEAEKRHRDSLEESPDPILVHRSGVIVFANRAAADLAAVDHPVDFVGRRVIDFVPRSERRKLVKQLSAMGDSSREVPEIVVDSPLGKRSLEITALPTTWDGRTAVQVLIRDVTEQRLAEVTAAESQRELQSLFDRIPVALYRSRPDGKVVAANPATLELFGWNDLADVDEASAGQVYSDAGVRRDWRRRMDENDIVRDFEQKMLTSDGTPIWVSDSARVVRDDDGNVLYYEGAMVDITGQRVAEESRERLARILEQTTDLVIVCTLEGELVYVNGASRRFFSLPGDLSEVTVESLVHGEQVSDRLSLVTAIRDAVLADGAWSGELDLLGPDSSASPISAVVQLLESNNGDRFVSVIARDITEIKRVQRQLSDMVESKDEFVAAVSHELCTPLAAVVGLTQELAENPSRFGRQERSELISVVAEQAAEVSNIVDDLLVAARAGIGTVALNPTTVDLADSVQLVIKALPEGLRERIESPGVSGTAHADPQRLRQILRNLFTNADRYGGDRIRVSSSSNGAGTFVEVADDGAGIPKAAQERVFRPYERAHDTGTQPASVGLGLTVSRQLAQLMDGELTYRYEGGWSVFRLNLPDANGHL